MKKNGHINEKLFFWPVLGRFGPFFPDFMDFLNKTTKNIKCSKIAKKAGILLKFGQHMYFDVTLRIFQNFCKKYKICPIFPDYLGFSDYAEFFIFLPILNDD